MRPILLALMLLTAAMFCIEPAGSAQDHAQLQTSVGYYKVFPLKSVDSLAVMRGVAAATTIPLFNYSIVSSVNGVSYHGMMVGRSPFFHGKRTTNIKTVIVPIIVKTADGGVFDPTKADATCAGGNIPLSLAQSSPIFQTHDFVMNGVDVGVAQYLDAYQREFLD